MPPRKSNVSIVTNGDGEVSTPKDAPRHRDSLGVEDLNLPRTMIARLSKGVLPPNTQIQKDALLALSKSATVFVNFLAANAGEFAQSAGKKTIMPRDVFAALKDQEFEAFLPRVEAETAKYNEIQCDKRNTYRRTKKAEQKATSGDGDTEMAGDASVLTNGANEDDAEGPPSKKIRREPGDEGIDADDDEGGDEDDDVPDEEDSAEEDVEDEDEEVEDEVEGGEADQGGDGELDDPDGGRLDLNGIRDEALDEPDSD